MLVAIKIPMDAKFQQRVSIYVYFLLYLYIIVLYLVMLEFRGKPEWEGLVISESKNIHDGKREENISFSICD